MPATVTHIVEPVTSNRSHRPNTAQPRRYGRIAVRVKMLALHNVRTKFPDGLGNGDQPFQARGRSAHKLDRDANGFQPGFPYIAAGQSQTADMCSRRLQRRRNVEDLPLRTALAESAGQEADAKVTEHRARWCEVGGQ